MKIKPDEEWLNVPLKKRVKNRLRERAELCGRAMAREAAAIIANEVMPPKKKGGAK